MTFRLGAILIIIIMGISGFVFSLASVKMSINYVLTMGFTAITFAILSLKESK